VIAHLDDRRVLCLVGDGVRDFLNGLVTSDLADLSPNRPAYAALLSAQGKYLADMLLFDGGGDRVYIDVHRDRADDLVRKLKLYRLRRRIDIVETALHVFAGWREKSLARPADPRHAALGARWLSAGEVVDAARSDYDAHRIALGIPDTADFDVGKTMWLETNAAELNGVSFTKGCYVGQENTARMNWRAKVTKRLLPVIIDGAPGEASAILADGKPAGELRSRAGTKAIALLRLDLANTLLRLGTARVTVEWPDWLPRSTAEEAP